MSAGRIAVVGGGLAGIAAALACADGGARVTLFEAKARLGGATYSFEHAGLRLDNGQHVYLRCCTAYRQLLRRIGSDGLTALQPRLAIPVLAPGGRLGWLRRNGLPAPLHLGAALARYPYLTWRDRLAVVRAAVALARLDLNDAALDRQTFGAWLRVRGQSRRALASLWELITLPTLNLRCDEASLGLAAMVFQQGLLFDHRAGDVGYARVPLGVAHGEQALAALQATGVDVCLDTAVTSVRPEGSGFAVEADGARVDVESAVVAVPHQRVAELLPPHAHPRLARFAALGATPIVNVHVVYDRRVMEHPFAAGVGTPVQWVFDRTAAAGLRQGQCLAVSLSGADGLARLANEAIEGQILPALATLFPVAAQARVRLTVVTREHAATFRQAPGSRELRPGPRTRVPGLFLAGAWTDTGWPATMEGAVRSGVGAAREALIHLHRTGGGPPETGARAAARQHP